VDFCAGFENAGEDVRGMYNGVSVEEVNDVVCEGEIVAIERERVGRKIGERVGAEVVGLALVGAEVVGLALVGAEVVGLALVGAEAVGLALVGELEGCAIGELVGAVVEGEGVGVMVNFRFMVMAPGEIVRSSQNLNMWQNPNSPRTRYAQSAPCVTQLRMH
jgi:hypothetical protein